MKKPGNFIYEQLQKRTVYVLIGPPAIGKSTYIKNTFKNAVVVSRDDIVSNVAATLGLTYDDLYVYPTPNDEIGELVPGKEKFGPVIKNDDERMKQYYPTTFEKVSKTNKMVANVLRSAINSAITSGKDIAIDMVNMSKLDRKINLGDINKHPEFKKVAVVFNFKDPDTTDIIAKLADKRNQEIKKQGGSKTISPEVIKRILTSFEEPTSDEGYNEIIHVNTLDKLRDIANGLNENYEGTKFTEIENEEIKNHFERQKKRASIKNYAQFSGKDGKIYYVINDSGAADIIKAYNFNGHGFVPIGYLYLHPVDVKTNTYTADAGKNYAVHVEPEFRRKGIASAMYDFAEQEGYNVIPSKLIHPGAAAVWKKRKPGINLDERLAWNEYPDFFDSLANPTFRNRPYPKVAYFNQPLSETEMSASEVNTKKLPYQFPDMITDFISEKSIEELREIAPKLNLNQNSIMLIKQMDKEYPGLFDNFAQWISDKIK